ncbi:transcription activator amyR [Fusarium tjaetaba]|uniref:Transcription activator amyR n=1 Tax=Fusarium tjaetaba TaxID=1567544 RepID=A0A8H5RFR5_9HYPO|nr:transcription activator amyR [Fusarium tjaetaba]KAF5631101.1 transcription activator amyR [Fusarium tjaetaba]
MNQVVFDSSLGCAVQTRSCDHCFHRKIKCDRRTPCAPCQENRVECQYERPRKKRRYIRPASDDPDVNSRVSSERQNVLYEDRGDWMPVQTVDVSTPTQAQQLDSECVNNSTQLTTVSPVQLETEYWDLGMGECFFYPTNLFGLVDLPPSMPSFPLNIPQSPSLCLSPPLQHVSSQNGVLDRLLDDSTIPQLIDVFLERLQQSMPFFTRSYLHQNIARQRHLQDRSFGSLVQAICSLVLLQPVQSQEKRSWPNREARADAHLALAVNLHSQSDLGQSPTLETIMTSVFLFACQFCKGNFDAARFRLREAAALAEVMNLDKPESYGRIGDTEKQRRLRTLISLTIIERIYSVQRDYIPATKLLSRNKLRELQNAIASSHDRGESENIIAMECISNMLEQVDFIDPDIIKCWKGFCWEEEAPTHVTRSTILTLLRRYRIPPQFSGLSGIDTHAQHADILVTRHWIRIKLWSLANSHGYVEALSDDEEFRHEYAVTIASEALDTCLQFQMTSLEVHGIGLADSSSSLSSPPASPQIDVSVEGLLREVIRNINDRLNTLETTARDHGQHLARIDRSLANLTATTTNLHARALNSTACASSSALTPLVSPVTGGAIPDFPRTYGEVQRLNGTYMKAYLPVVAFNADFFITARELGGLLRSLGLRGARNAEQKRGDFIRAIGITKLVRR